jgi:hypothetical protein
MNPGPHLWLKGSYGIQMGPECRMGGLGPVSMGSPLVGGSAFL